ncbi:MAG: alpha/beta fold hydrolase [Lewinellaceae bacterium]|nr:alpha/beta fold hydrolase [Lewinellaceae bacterium]
METFQVNRNRFPFESRFVEIDGHRMHYIDEGVGKPILFSHGTPEWSFGWRDIVQGLRGQFRCIAPDLLGFGLSDKPTDADYSVAAHARRMEQFIQQLGLRDFHVVANDFGLSIAFHYVLRHPEQVQRISFFNGWMWPLHTDPHYARPARIMRTWLGRLLYLRFNFPVTVVMPAAFGDKRNLIRKSTATTNKPCPTRNPAGRPILFRANCSMPQTFGRNNGGKWVRWPASLASFFGA